MSVVGIDLLGCEPASAAAIRGSDNKLVKYVEIAPVPIRPAFSHLFILVSPQGAAVSLMPSPRAADSRPGSRAQRGSWFFTH